MPTDPVTVGYWCENCKTIWQLMRFSGWAKEPPTSVDCCEQRTIPVFTGIESMKAQWEKGGGLDHFMTIAKVVEKWKDEKLK